MPVYPVKAPGSLSRCHLRAPRRGFGSGFTTLVDPRTRRGDPAGMGMDFGILKLRAGAKHHEVTARETAIVLLGGRVEARIAGNLFGAQRGSLFDEGPTTFHVGAGTSVELRADAGGAEFAVIRAVNPRPLPVRVYTPAETATEDRGAGLAQGACRRLVRTIFDYSTRPDSTLVVGEVVNFPGRWSSYPGHHHAQPEIYHYRFTLPQGYGHAEIGESVFKVRHGDTTTIPGGLDHAQVSAPGYGMYYLWVVRHLPRRPYKGFTFTREHTWLLDPKNQGWQPSV
ncbi:5-deoxy-glucuronate isomerase [Oleiharenicola lentus]|nr:5-deoxy-glucuronate isomerase [Oleiharenicola lentus]